MAKFPDPRLVSVYDSVNEQLLDRAIRHAIYLERLKTSEVIQTISFLNDDVLPDLLDQIQRRLGNIAARGFDTSLRSTQRLRDLSLVVNEHIRTGFSTLSSQAQSRLKDIAFFESAFQLTTMRQAVPFELDFRLPAKSTLNAIVSGRPMNGELIPKWFEQSGVRLRNDVTRQINVGLVQGEGVDDIVRRLRGTKANNFADGIVQKSRRELETLTRTSVNHTVTQARDETYKENEDVVKAVQYVATLDDRTTVTCASLDGQIFKIGEGPRPPMHMNCRSTTVPVLKSWDELGIPGLKEIPPSTRASMDGQVPASQKYPDWLKKQSPDVQDKVLGKTRADMFRKGDVSFDKFVNDKNQPLTLKQIAELEDVKLPKSTPPPASSPVGVEWKPSMTPSAADEFAKEGVVEEILYHHTSKSAAENIRKEGFNLSDGILGKGVYLTNDASGIGINRRHVDTVMEISVRAKNVVDTEGGYVGMRKWMDEFGEGFDNPIDAARAAGVDAFRVPQPDGSKWMIVVDKKNVTVRQPLSSAGAPSLPTPTMPEAPAPVPVPTSELPPPRPRQKSSSVESPEPVKNERLFHGGGATDKGMVTYYSDSKKVAESYAQMFEDRFGSEGRVFEKVVFIDNPAPQSKISAIANSVGIDNTYYTPASVFDTELHGRRLVSRLIMQLKAEGYDGAILEDIPYGSGEPFKAYIKFNPLK